MTETALDRAHAATVAGPENDAARLRFYERLADAVLVVPLESEDRPRIFPLEDGPVVLAFDREDRLADLVPGAAYAELTGRSLAPMLAEAGLGLGLNLGVAPSSILLPARAMSWLADTLAFRPGRCDSLPETVEAPAGVPEALVEALEAKMPALAGLARSGFLATARYGGGDSGLILAFLGARDGAEDALSRAAGEALIFSGLDDGALDVAFLASDSPAVERFERVALRFDFAPPESAARPSAPGLDPERPPKLR